MGCPISELKGPEFTIYGFSWGTVETTLTKEAKDRKKDPALKF